MDLTNPTQQLMRLLRTRRPILKANYPAEFMACLISLEASDAEKMAFYLSEAKTSGITILPPDINMSLMDFDAVQNTGEALSVRFGLKGIKNVGQAALEEIFLQREKGGPFIDMLDLCTRIDLRVCNKRVLESLICSGACDVLPGNRAQKCEELGKIIDRAFEKKRAAETGQLGLFHVASSGAENLPEHYSFIPLAEWPERVKLEKEKEVVGIFITAHPLDSYAQMLTWLNVVTVQKLAEQGSSTQNVLVVGFIKSSRTITTKKGDTMAFMQLEDKSATAEIVIFPKLYEKVSSWLKEHMTFVIDGVPDSVSKDLVKIKAQSIIPLDLLVKDGLGVEGLTLTLPAMFSEELLSCIKQSFTAGPTKLSFVVHENGKRLRIASKERIAYSATVCSSLAQHGIAIALDVKSDLTRVS